MKLLYRWVGYTRKIDVLKVTTSVVYSGTYEPKFKMCRPHTAVATKQSTNGTRYIYILVYIYQVPENRNINIVQQHMTMLLYVKYY